MLIKKMKYNLTAYHCPNCGGVTNPENGECDYCKSQIRLKQYLAKEIRRRGARLLVDCDGNYVYMNNVTAIKRESHSQISVNTLSDMRPRYLASEELRDMSLDLTLHYDHQSMIDFEKKVLGRGKSIRARIELLGRDRAIETKLYFPSMLPMPEFASNELIETSFTTIVDGDIKQFDTVVPEGCTCPNCGAPIKSRYGCCDYCSGWVEWSF